MSESINQVKFGLNIPLQMVYNLYKEKGMEDLILDSLLKQVGEFKDDPKKVCGTSPMVAFSGCSIYVLTNISQFLEKPITP